MSPVDRKDFCATLLAEIDAYMARGGLPASDLSLAAGFCQNTLSTIRRRGVVSRTAAAALRKAMQDNPPRAGQGRSWVPEGRLHVRRFGAYHAVFAGKTKVSGPLGSLEIATATRDRLDRERGQSRRRCMTCTKPFSSDGPHNRMCESCRQLSVHDGAA